MNLLIVEDELYVRERISEGIDWLSNGIQMIDAVGNAKDALIVMNSTHIDIVLTDIYMPEMNGLELANEINMVFPLVKLIILTGYDEFEHAQKSIEYGVFKFLVKPAENDEIIAAVIEAKVVKEKELMIRRDLYTFKNRWEKHLPHIQMQFYKSWLYGRYSNWEIVERSEELLLNLKERVFLPVVLDMDPVAEKNDRFTKKDRSLIQFSLFTIARDLINTNEAFVLQDDDGTTIIVFTIRRIDYDEDWYVSVNSSIHNIIDMTKNHLKLTASAGIGPLAKNIEGLPKAFNKGRLALKNRLTLGNGMAIPYREVSLPDDNFIYINTLENKLQVAIETENLDECQRTIQALMEHHFNDTISLTKAQEVLWRLVGMLVKLVHQYDWTLSETILEDFKEFEQFNQLLSREQIEEWLHNMTTCISKSIALRRQTGTEISMNEVINFMYEHMHNDQLSLYYISNKMFMSYSYLSRIFKQIMGDTFSSYLLRIRMERAKLLLSQGAKVYEAAEQVGYKHVNYFSRSFQKYWGVKPSDI